MTCKHCADHLKSKAWPTVTELSAVWELLSYSNCGISIVPVYPLSNQGSAFLGTSEESLLVAKDNPMCCLAATYQRNDLLMYRSTLIRERLQINTGRKMAELLLLHQRHNSSSTRWREKRDQRPSAERMFQPWPVQLSLDHQCRSPRTSPHRPSLLEQSK